MSMWRRHHLDATLTAVVIPDNHRYFVCLREPASENRHPIEFFRWKLRDAQRAGDRLAQMYYPHDCDESNCGKWEESEY